MTRKHRIFKIAFIGVVSLSAFVFIVVGSICIYTHKSIDFKADEALFLDSKADNSIRLYYDASGSVELSDYKPVLYEEINLYGKNHTWYSYNEFSPYLINGFVAMEDRGFFSHHGIDFKRTSKALLNYIFSKESSFGGSTITQQVIKNISGNNERTVKRKLNELIRAYHLEFSHSKEEIFEVYLNIIPMSNNITGAGQAAVSFFGKEPSYLNPAEAAAIIAITNAPTKYNPYRNYDECLKKRNKVLYAMYSEGVIDKSAYVEAKNSPISLVSEPEQSENGNSWFAKTVISDVIEDYSKKYGYSYEAGRALLFKKGVNIYTTVDPTIQNVLEAYFENEDNFPSEIKDGLEYSMVISEPNGSSLRAIVGATDKKCGFNYSTLPRAPGSVLKPLALYLPLIESKKITWSTVFDDIPVSFSENPDGTFNEYPKNYPQVYDGLTTVSDALRLSKNTVAVRLYNLLGAEKIYNYLVENFDFDTLIYKKSSKNGIVTDLAPSPLALGQLSYGVTLRKLTESYNVFANEGTLSSGRSYIAVFDASGNLLIENERREKKICEKESARVMNQMLMGVVENGTGSKITLKFLYDTAGKTGTSGNDLDRFFIGYTPYYTAGIWCGYPDKNASVGSHYKNHFTVWDDVMKLVHEAKIKTGENGKNFSTKDLLYKPYCKDSGELFSTECLHDQRGSRLEYGYFIKGTEPRVKCSRHILVEYTEGEYIDIPGKKKIVSFVDIDLRTFPKEIFVADEEFAYRKSEYYLKHRLQKMRSVLK